MMENTNRILVDPIFRRNQVSSSTPKVLFLAIIAVMTVIAIWLNLANPSLHFLPFTYLLIIIFTWWVRLDRVLVPISLITSLCIFLPLFNSSIFGQLNDLLINNQLVALACIWGITLLFFKSIKDEEKLKSEFEAIKHVIDIMTDAVIFTDDQSIIIGMSPSAESMFGYHSSELIGQPILTLFPDKEGELATDANKIPQSIIGLFGHNGDTKAINKEKNLFDAHVKVTTLSINGIYCYCAEVRDVSIEKSSFNSIVESEERLAKAQQLTHLGSWEWLVQSDELYWSAEMYRLWEVPMDEPASYSTFFSRLHPDDKERVQEQVNKALEGHGFSIEYRIVTDNGVEKHIYAEGEVVFDEHGLPDKFHGTAQNISEQKRQMEEIAKYQRKLEKLVEEKTQQLVQVNAANEVKIQFLANTSHELRTPLHGIIATLDLLKNQSLDKKQSHLLEISRLSADNLLILINEILDYSKLETNQARLDFITTNIYVLVSEVMHSFSTSIRSKRIKASCLISTNVPEVVITDPQKVRQILLNLIGNAIKFTNTSDVQEGDIQVLVSWQNNQLVLQVKDNGIGIEKEKLEYLFEPFTQADASTNRKFGGTGLGLSIVKSVVELLKGDIQCDTLLNKGSTFTTTIPLTISPSIFNEKHTLSNFTIALYGLLPEQSIPLATTLTAKGANIVQLSSDEPSSFICSVLITTTNSYNQRTELLPDVFTIVLCDSSEYLAEPKPAHIVEIESNPFIPFFIVQTIEKKLLDQHKSSPISESEIIQAPQTKRILVAEDNLHNQEVISYQLDELAFDYRIVDNGAQVLDILKKESFDLIITDCHMPELDGYRLTEQIRKNQSDVNSDIPIIGMTGDVSEAGLALCKSVGMNDVIAKPSRLDELQRILERVFSEKQSKPKAKTRSAIDLTHPDTKRENLLPSSFESTAKDLSDETAIKYIGDDMKAISSLRSSFIEKNKPLIEDLEKSIESQDKIGIRQGLHKLKSSALFIGADRLHLYCAFIEEQLLPNDKQISSEQLRDTQGLIEEFYLLKDKINALTNSSQGA